MTPSEIRAVIAEVQHSLERNWRPSDSNISMICYEVESLLGRVAELEAQFTALEAKRLDDIAHAYDKGCRGDEDDDRELEHD